MRVENCREDAKACVSHVGAALDGEELPGGAYAGTRQSGAGLEVSVLTESVERLVGFAYEQKTNEARDLVIEEMRRMLTGYLFVRG